MKLSSEFEYRELVKANAYGERIPKQKRAGMVYVPAHYKNGERIKAYWRKQGQTAFKRIPVNPIAGDHIFRSTRKK